MRFGPCGGAQLEGTCEVDRRPCPFLDAAHEARLAQHAFGSQRVPVSVDLPVPAIVVDVRAPVDWPGDQRRLWQAVAASLHGCVALLGEHVDNARGTDDAGLVAPVFAIETLTSEGVPTIATVTGRDRNLTGARATMRRYSAAGAVAIHCVTGDHPAALSIARPAEFGAEAVSLAALANDLGLATTVGESPASPGPRIERLAVKRAAGATMCILNHSGDVSELADFAGACRARGVDVPLIAPIPMVADLRAAAALVRFPGLRLPTGFVDIFADVIAGAADPVETSIVLSAQMAGELAATGLFIGVNLSGSAVGTDPYARIELTTRFVAAARSAWNANTDHSGADR